MYIFAEHNSKCWIVYDIDEGKYQYLKQNNLIDNGKIFINVLDNPIEIDSRHHVYILKINDDNDINELWILEYNICKANGSGETTYIEYYTNMNDLFGKVEDIFHDVTHKTKSSDVTKLRNKLIKNGEYMIPIKLLNEDNEMNDYTFKVYSLLPSK
jgi:hypothetical protein